MNGHRVEFKPISKTERIVDTLPVSPRQKQIVVFMCRGLKYADIARAIGCSPHNVRNNVCYIFKKLNLKSKAELFSKILDISVKEKVNEQVPTDQD